MNKDIVVGIGEVLWDILPDGKKMGGAPANFAYHISQFGLNSCVVSAVGDDTLGDELIENFDRKKLNYILERVPYPTGSVAVRLDENGVPSYDIKQNVAWDNIPDTSELKCLARRTKAVCFGSLAQRADVSRCTISDFISNMGDGDDILKIFDINLRQHFYTAEIIHSSLEKCNILKINDEELATIGRLFNLSGMTPEADCIKILEKYNLKMLILTCGVNGSYVFGMGETSYVPTPKIEVADTVGAGDSFTAAFVASILKGKSIRESHEIAVGVSAFVCSCHGAMPLLPTCLATL